MAAAASMAGCAPKVLLATALVLLSAIPARADSTLQADSSGIVRIKLRRVQAASHSHEDAEAHLRGHSRARRSLLQLQAGAKAGAAPSARRPEPVQVFGVLPIGSPAQEFTMAFDTGSGNMLVPSSACQSISCLSHRPYDESSSVTAKAIPRLDSKAGDPVPADGMGREQAKVQVGTGSAMGMLAMDRVCLDKGESVCVDSGLIEATTMSDEPFNLLPYDGILGLGLPGSSLDMRFNLMGNLAEAGVLKRNMFAIWLAKEDDPEDSEITFGQIDRDRVGSNIMWLHMSDASSGLWKAKVLDYHINGKKLGLCGKTGCNVAFDTGTNSIAGPSRIITPVLEQLKIDTDCANYATLPLLGFHFGEYELQLEPSDYVQKKGTSCWPKINTLDLPPPTGPVMLLGDPFLKKYYTIYDRTALKIGLAFAPHKSASDQEDESTEEAAKRLMIHHGVGSTVSAK